MAVYSGRGLAEKEKPENSRDAWESTDRVVHETGFKMRLLVL